jgi:hypothetical protein
MLIKANNGQNRFTIGSILVFALVALTGCPTARDPIPDQPVSPTDSGIVDKVGKEIDKSDSRLAAAVTVARENAERPAVVRAETGVALSYLPAPTEADVAFARQRATKADPAEYKRAEDAGRRLLAAIDLTWSKMEANQREALRISSLKDTRIADLTKEVEAVKKDGLRNSSMVGAGFCVLIALGLALVGQYIKAAVAGLFALLCSSVPFLLDTPWFLPILAGVIFSGLIVGGVAAFRKSRPVPAVVPSPLPLDKYTKSPDVPKES